MNFLKELHWGDAIKIQATFEEDPNQLFVIKNDVKCFALAIEYS
jgi:hypothetical protein